MRLGRSWFKTNPGTHFIGPHFQKNQLKMVWKIDSIGRASALQTWSPEFKPKLHQKKAQIIEENDKLNLKNFKLFGLRKIFTTESWCKSNLDWKKVIVHHISNKTFI
jgi:hypothetical protein